MFKTIKEFRQWLYVEKDWPRGVVYPIKAFQSFLANTLNLPSWLVFPIWYVQSAWYYRNYKPGAIFQSCSLHPCKITKFDLENDDIEGVSILDGREDSCSLSHCGVYLMEQHEIDQYVEAWNRDGERGILTIYSGSEEAADEFIKNWR